MLNLHVLEMGSGNWCELCPINIPTRQSCPSICISMLPQAASTQENIYLSNSMWSQEGSQYLNWSNAESGLKTGTTMMTKVGSFQVKFMKNQKLSKGLLSFASDLNIMIKHDVFNVDSWTQISTQSLCLNRAPVL